MKLLSPVSHVDPVYRAPHRQCKDPPSATHLPSFKHGTDTHGSAAVIKRKITIDFTSVTLLQLYISVQYISGICKFLKPVRYKTAGKKKVYILIWYIFSHRQTLVFTFLCSAVYCILLQSRVHIKTLFIVNDVFPTAGLTNLCIVQ